MTRRRYRAARGAARDVGTLLGVLGRYWLGIYPIVRRELDRWQARARRIEGPIGAIARGSLSCERLNPEGAALFAVLAPCPLRASVVRLLVSFEVMYDFIDALTEQPLERLLSLSRDLHAALKTALGAPRPCGGYYASYPHGDDGGYLEELVAECRRLFLRLPAARVVTPLLLHAVSRSAEGQSLSHAAACDGDESLIRWATGQAPRALGLRWWETAAASESTLVVHALLASAADRRLTAQAAHDIADAYWPWITGLNALLDDLVDLEEDAANGTHSYVALYPNPEIAAQRLGAIAGRASRGVRGLPHGRQHATILAAMTGFYLSAPGAGTPGALAPADAVRQQFGIDLRLLVVVLRLRRRLSAESRSTAGAAPEATHRWPPHLESPP
jgi:tetraprenyl-beta-curcumene synthase